MCVAASSALVAMKSRAMDPVYTVKIFPVRDECHNRGGCTIPIQRAAFLSHLNTVLVGE
jgi:hypothetical protein